MRLVLASLVVFVLAGCGTAQEASRMPASSGPESTATVSPTGPEVDAKDLGPPAIVLRSRGGDQLAVRGSFCVEYEDPDSGQGQGICGDSAAVHPKAVTAVNRGDEVTFLFTGAQIVRPSGCHSDREQDCIGSVQVKPLGCERPEIESVPLTVGRETSWTVDLAAGAYQLDVFAYFESDRGATGDVSGSLGLTVAGAKTGDALGVLDLSPAMQVCPFASVEN